MLHASPPALTSLALLSLLAAPAQAQRLIVDHGQLVARSGIAAPGVPGATLSTNFWYPDVDDQGQLLFVARLSGGAVTTADDGCLMRGSSLADLSIEVREGAPAPGLPGILLGDFALNGWRLSESGRLTFTCNLTGPGVTTADDSALFSGPAGAPLLHARRGSPAPGTAGAAFDTNFQSIHFDEYRSNDAGEVLFHSLLTGGDVFLTTNHRGVWLGRAGAPQLIARLANPIPSGEVLFDLDARSLALGPDGYARCAVHFDQSLGVPATPANDAALLVHVPGSGLVIQAREGDPAPGTVGASFGAFGQGLIFRTNSRCFASGGRSFFGSFLTGGDAVLGVNDQGLYFGAPGAIAPVARTGDVAPGTGGLTYRSFVTSASSFHTNQAGDVTFIADLNGALPIERFNLFAGPAASPTLLARSGTAAPGTAGALLQIPQETNLLINDAGQILFESMLRAGVGDTTPSNNYILYHWAADTGWRVVVRLGDVLEVAPGVFKTVTGWGLSSSGMGDTGGAGFRDDGPFGLWVFFGDGSQGLYVIDPPHAGAALCAGDGGLADHTTACPCGNDGAAGHGCAHSFSAAGGLFEAEGSTWADEVLLTASNLPVSSFTLFMQHDAAGDALFHDGVLCAGGTLVRLRGRNAVAGLATFPNSSFPNDATLTLSQRGGVTVGSGAVRRYAAFYRNASTTFCPPATANVTNGWEIVW